MRRTQVYMGEWSGALQRQQSLPSVSVMGMDGSVIQSKTGRSHLGRRPSFKLFQTHTGFSRKGSERDLACSDA